MLYVANADNNCVVMIDVSEPTKARYRAQIITATLNTARPRECFGRRGVTKPPGSPRQCGAFKLHERVSFRASGIRAPRKNSIARQC
jgi:hypothetical protein